MAGDRPEKFAEYTALNCWADAEKMLRGKVSGREVAEFIHNQGEMLHLSAASVTRQVLRYRAERIKPLALTSLIDDVIRGQNLDFDDLDEMAKVILLQKQRVDRDLLLEEKMPKSMPSLSKEIELLFSLMERHHKLKQDSGMAPRAPQQHLHALLNADETPYGKILKALPDERRTALREEIALGYGDDSEGIIPGQYRIVDEDDS